MVIAITVSPLAQASISAEAQNGTIAAALAASIQANLTFLKKELGDLAFSTYQQGRTTSSGIEDVSNPHETWVTNHKQFYCSPNIAVEASAFGCRAAAGTAEESKYLELGDVKASVLLGPTAYSDILDIAAQDFIRNIINPYPVSNFKKSIQNSNFIGNRADTEAYAKYMANQALLSVSLNSLNQSYFMRLPGRDLGVSSAPGSSIMTVMENEATRRFTSNEWYTTINNPNFDQLAVAKEQLAMAAFDQWMAYQNFKQNERIATLLAALLAKTVNINMEPNQVKK